MHNHLLNYACILSFIYGISSSVIQERRLPKIDEFNNFGCTTTHPDGTTDNQPTFHHSPPELECVGIDPSTKSVIILTGPAYGAVYGYYNVGVCDNDKWGSSLYDITFDKNIDGGSSCHPVDFGNGTRVHDIMFPD